MPKPRDHETTGADDAALVATIDAREAAYRAVYDVLRHAGFAADKLARLRQAGRLPSEATALATEIALGAVRHLLLIDHVLSRVARYDPRRVEPRLRALLACAVYQLVWLDRVPEFAAVDETVDLTRRHIHQRAAGMANAILRRLTRSIAARRVAWEPRNPRHLRVSWSEACAFDCDVLPDASNPELHLAIAAAERPARYRTFVERFGSAGAEEMAWAAQAVPPLVLFPNRLRLTPEKLAEACRAHFGDVVEVADDATFLPAAVHLSDLPEWRTGGAFVQDSTAHAPVRLLGARPGECVLDRCAAPGGKSVALAIDMRDEGCVIACDVDERRLALVRENAARLGLACVTPQHTPAEAVTSPVAPAACDAALVDVPCSNTGVVARRPEVRLRFHPRKLGRLVELQLRLLRESAACVRPAGRLVYSTCSIEPEENEQVVAAFLRDQPAWELQAQQLTRPRWGPRRSDWRDGGFAALLCRNQ